MVKKLDPRPSKGLAQGVTKANGGCNLVIFVSKEPIQNVRLIKPNQNEQIKKLS